jgi:hypothetical protein
LPGVLDAGGEDRALRAAAAVLREGCRVAEPADAFVDEERPGPGGFAAVVGDVARPARPADDAGGEGIRPLGHLIALGDHVGEVSGLVRADCAHVELAMGLRGPTPRENFIQP